MSDQPQEQENTEPVDDVAADVNEAVELTADEAAEERIIELEAQLAEMKESLLRQRAETENVRRRGEKDKTDAAAYAVTGFARDMLSVTDNLRRALDALPEEMDDAVKGFVEGVELTERELLATFERHKIIKVDPEVGSKFDPNLHQAMFEVPTTDFPNGAIMQVVGAGYQIKDRLLRPAMVGVAKNEGAVDSVDTQA